MRRIRPWPASARDLAESERRYQALVDQLPAIVYTAEAGAAGQWRFVSHQVETKAELAARSPD